MSSISHLPDISPSDADFLESQLDEHLGPDGRLATDTEIGRMIAEMESVLPQRRKSEGEGMMQLQVFRRAVNELPKGLLARACFRATKELQWFPTPSQIITFANEEGNRRQNRIFIMRRLLAKAGRMSWPHEAGE
ncbi:MAG: hypothetical protein AAFW97_14640 [Pseudomonadota bacterium]